MTRPGSHILRRALPALAAVALLLGAAAPAHAARPLVLATTNHGPAFDGNGLDDALTRAHSAGVRALRVYLSWEQIAPGGTSKPPGFNASDPGDPRYHWLTPSNCTSGFQQIVNSVVNFRGGIADEGARIAEARKQFWAAYPNKPGLAVGP